MNEDELAKAKEHLVRELLWERECKEWAKANFIEFDNFFKYSGKTEPIHPWVEQYFNNKNHRVDALSRFYTKQLKEKNKKNGTNNNTNDK